MKKITSKLNLNKLTILTLTNSLVKDIKGGFFIYKESELTDDCPEQPEDTVSKLVSKK